jgi:flagellar basal body-associated protein FliL
MKVSGAVFKKPLVLASICVVVAGLLAAGTTFLLVGRASSGGPDENETAGVHLTEKLMYPLGDFTINLVDADRYLRTTIQLEVEVPVDPEGKHEEESAEESGHGGGHGSGGKETADRRFKEITDRLPVFKDGVIEIISSYKFQELLTVEGKRRLKTELIDMFNDRCHGVKVLNIFFTTFTMQ